jgi:DEAD/DEAH box helicase domain-containing protein
MSDAPLAFSRRPAPPWAGLRGLPAVVDRWKRDPAVDRCFVLDVSKPERVGRYADVPPTLAAPVRAALEKRGVHRLYTHQRDAFERVQAGRDVVVATPTASGKSLCYNLPVLDRLATKPSTRALYLFPTKALSRDQEESLRTFLADAELSQGAITYDGDTPGDARRAARERSGILITNPDMLHAGILPHHASWARFFAHLELIVVDELHSYRGVFGSHLANLMRRLVRIARFHGADPRFVFASATIGNPSEHASRLSGREVELVAESGAPTGEKQVLVYNPPIVNAELGIRASTLKSAVRLASDLVAAEVSTIIFAQSRNSVEVMLKYMRDRLIKDGRDPQLVQGYRAGYLPEQRRRIEAGLRSGEVRCVVSTSALELGIDIGSLDAVICAGYPGSLAELWQRFGRAGRRQGKSLAVLITSSAPLDQYLAREPEYLAGAPIEEARIDPDNLDILLQHLKCAAFELPFEVGDPFGDVPEASVGDALQFLADNRVLQPVTNAAGKTLFHWASDAYPANAVSLRNVGWDNVVIIDVEAEKTIAEMDWHSTHTMLHEQAIYQHDGEQYQVERLDLPNHKAYVRLVEPDYYTTAMTHTKVKILHEDQRADVALGNQAVGALASGLGDVNVIEKVVGYKKIKFHTHENVGYGEVQLPEIQKPTTAFWLTFPRALFDALPAPRPVVIDAIRGLGSALHTVAAVGLMIDPRDLGRTLVDGVESDTATRAQLSDDLTFDPTLYLYDQFAGGVGLAPRLFEEREALLQRARRLLVHCDCGDGCPACVGPSVGVDDPTLGRWSRKALSLDVLGALGVGEG